MKLLDCRSAFLPLLLVACTCAPLALSAQNDGTNGPPNVLVIQREFTKPGRGGAMHEKTEGDFIHALDAAKASPHYLAMISLTGPSRALFFSGYNSLADWETENKSVFGNAALSSALDRANVVDGDLLSSTDASVWILRPDLSLNTSGLTGRRYMELTAYTVRPGHSHEWDELVKLVTDGYKKSSPDEGWAMFESKYGPAGHEFLIVRALKSFAEIDHEMTEDKGFMDAMGPDNMKRLGQLESSCVQSDESNLFVFDPKMSRPPESWVKAEPDYWRPKSSTPARRTAPKPAASTNSGQ